MKLRWNRDFKNSDSEFAYCGDGMVGMVVPRDDGSVVWQIDAVSMRYIGKGYGETRSVKTAKIALQRNWDRWLKLFELDRVT